MNENEIDRIVHDGGEFFVIEVENRGDPGTWRPVTRETTREAAKIEIDRCRSHDTLGRIYRPRKVVVTSTVLDW